MACPRTGTTTFATSWSPGATRISPSARSRSTWPGATSPPSPKTRPPTNHCGAWPPSGSPAPTSPCRSGFSRELLLWLLPLPSQGRELRLAAEAAPTRANRSVRRRSVQHQRAQRARDRRQRSAQLDRLALVGVHVDHHVAHIRVRAQVLAVDVDAVAAEDLVHLRQHARHVAGDVQQAAAAGVAGPGDLGEVHRRQRAAVVAVAHQRSEEHTSELQSLMRHSSAVFCLKKKTTNTLATTRLSRKRL